MPGTFGFLAIPSEKGLLNLVFTSKVSKSARQALEELFFFNPRQYRVREAVINSLSRFGHPRIENTVEGLTIKVGNQEAQTLFVYDRSRARDDLVGVVVFMRTSPGEITILHVAVHPDYALQGRHAGLGLTLTLIEKVKEIASRIVGVQRIALPYHQEVAIPIR